ncbi:hypothetical protein [Bosea sp. 685]|uniref:hypothetical protein n=1 Tax=Bosea sp. 685 TaxID=3080057 RepID=UPI002892EF41|nr:hypothetical protein [Bosea sp. 685]WNJ88273.1 hypothetical protein RMR04_17815 [Bosea sp. 685]
MVQFDAARKGQNLIDPSWLWPRRMKIRLQGMTFGSAGIGAVDELLTGPLASAHHGCHDRNLPAFRNGGSLIWPNTMRQQFERGPQRNGNDTAGNRTSP